MNNNIAQGTGNGVSSPFNQFTSNSYTNSTKEFFESNSLVAKIAFLLLVLFVFAILLRLGIGILGYLLGPDDSPKLINGMVSAKDMIIIPQDPEEASAINISRSANATEGIEFTWSVWIYIDDVYKTGQYRCVFYKGNDYSSNPDNQSHGLNFPNNAPGLYLAPNTNDLVVFMNTFKVINEQVTIPDIPMKKWVNVMIRCQNTTLDIYINGTIAKSLKLHGVPKQNYGNVFVAANGGFDGYISNLWYYNYALGTSEINRLVNMGPDTTMSGTDSINMKTPNYLSLRWFFYGGSNAYN
jgi:Concanavalin A-like lectin/glucanases superfamily